MDALATQFLDALDKIGVLVDKMRAHSYDGTSVVSMHINGVQVRDRRVNPSLLAVAVTNVPAPAATECLSGCHFIELIPPMPIKQNPYKVYDLHRKQKEK